MVVFPALHPVAFIFLNSSDLLEHLAMLQTSPLAINFRLIILLNKAIGTINFAKLILNFTADLIPCQT